MIIFSCFHCGQKDFRIFFLGDYHLLCLREIQMTQEFVKRCCIINSWEIVIQFPEFLCNLINSGLFIIYSVKERFYWNWVKEKILPFECHDHRVISFDTINFLWYVIISRTRIKFVLIIRWSTIITLIYESGARSFILFTMNLSRDH